MLTVVPYSREFSRGLEPLISLPFALHWTRGKRDRFKQHTTTKTEDVNRLRGIGGRCLRVVGVGCVGW